MDYEGFGTQDRMTKFAPHNPLKFICGDQMTVDERSVERVAFVGMEDVTAALRKQRQARNSK